MQLNLIENIKHSDHRNLNSFTLDRFKNRDKSFSLRAECLKLSQLFLNGKDKDALMLLDNLIYLKSLDSKASSHQSWYTRLKELKEFYLSLNSDNVKIKFPIFAKDGNGKLPFLNYSTIPIVNCVGSGACETYCYSLNSMRFPNAVCKWLQNTIIENRRFDIIEAEFNKVLNSGKFKKMERIDFRLYNDGDFSSIEICKKWLNLLKKFPKVKAYGYTKSLNLFVQLTEENFQFPTNYKFNVSNGGIYDSLKDFPEIKNNVCYRGEFIAVNMGYKIKATKITKDERRAIKNKINDKFFMCPGVCGSCSGVGHACGAEEFKNKKIVIAVH